MSDKFEEWWESTKYTLDYRNDGIYIAEAAWQESERRAKQEMKAEIVKAIEKKFINRYRIISLDTVLDYIDKEF